MYICFLLYILRLWYYYTSPFPFFSPNSHMYPSMLVFKCKVTYIFYIPKYNLLGLYNAIFCMLSGLVMDEHTVWLSSVKWSALKTYMYIKVFRTWSRAVNMYSFHQYHYSMNQSLLTSYQDHKMSNTALIWKIYSCSPSNFPVDRQETSLF